MISTLNAEHYIWKEVCHGWHLVKADHLSVIQEQMPPHTAEDRHLHKTVRQFFFVLSGQAVLELDGLNHTLRAMEGLEVPPGFPHQMRNDSGADLEFLVVSSGTARLDRHPA
ncbi:MAG: cupin domain-containing protein [Meiothermus sp.]|nr:cupin domain-containing protein [Meiothermus sp.]